MVPRAILRWLVHPVVNDCLGEEILVEMARSSVVLGYSQL